MFRLLIFFVILGLITVTVYAGFKILESFKQNDKKQTTSEEVEHLIEVIKLKITRAEINASEGIEGAEKDLQHWKEELEKVKQIKEKTKNLK
jgi:hypothetical protein